MASIIGEKILGLFKKYKGGLPLNFIATLLKPTTFAEVSGEAFSLVEEGRAKMGPGGLYPVEPALMPQTADIGDNEAEAGAADTGDEMPAPISNISSDRAAAPDNGASAGNPISYDSQKDNDGNKNEAPVTAAHGKAGILPTPEKTLLYVGPTESHPKDEGGAFRPRTRMPQQFRTTIPGSTPSTWRTKLSSALAKVNPNPMTIPGLQTFTRMGLYRPSPTQRCKGRPGTPCMKAHPHMKRRME